MPGQASVVGVGPQSCKPFLLEVMVFSPEAGYKFEVLIERACSASNEAIWKIVFDLYKLKEDGEGFTQIIHVSYRSGTSEEAEGTRRMARDGVTLNQARRLMGPAYGAVKAVEGVPNPTEPEKQRVRDEMSKVARDVPVDLDL